MSTISDFYIMRAQMLIDKAEPNIINSFVFKEEFPGLYLEGDIGDEEKSKVMPHEIRFVPYPDILTELEKGIRLLTGNMEETEFDDYNRIEMRVIKERFCVVFPGISLHPNSSYACYNTADVMVCCVVGARKIEALKL